MQDFLVILNGTVEMSVTDMTTELNGGDAILIAPREVHDSVFNLNATRDSYFVLSSS
jgi:quercetin dioxygenase-like cupin family protein